MNVGGFRSPLSNSANPSIIPFVSPIGTHRSLTHPIYKPNSLISFLGFLCFGLFFEESRGSCDTTGSVQWTLGLGTAGGKCSTDWGPRSKLEQEGSLPTIFEFRNHLPEPLLPALIHRHPLYTHPPVRTRGRLCDTTSRLIHGCSVPFISFPMTIGEALLPPLFKSQSTAAD
ncbi:hypothetical protein TIFTF001_031265 [Ficus carica]|uniref:Uncharacterized protein n=1 Tax=Ficus carica TaxID=3494 RepID=A0AA88J3Z2_FICCA|nr:hypothetical protein TIFTF001_031265 [Ficus carica]